MAARAARGALSLLLAVSSFSAVSPASAAPVPVVGGQFTWDSQADFEANAATTGDPTTRTGVLTGSSPGSVDLPPVPSEPAVAIAAGVTHTIALGSNGRAAATGYEYPDGRCSKVATWTDLTAVAAGGEHTVGLLSDGTVRAVGSNADQQCAVEGWDDVVSIAAGVYNTVGVKQDGTVVATGGSDGQSNVSAWTGIESVSAGDRHTVGVTTAGTVVATGLNTDGQCDVGGWSDIKSVAAGKSYTIGLKNDGTVVTAGWPINGEATIESWTGIVAIATGRDVNSNHTVGLKADGTVVAAGYNWSGQCEVSSWTDIVAIAAGGGFTVGLKSNGEVVGAGNNYYRQIAGAAFSDIAEVTAGDYVTMIRRTNGSVQPLGDSGSDSAPVWGWTGIVKAVAGNSHYVGLRADGTVVNAGWTGDAGALATVNTWTGISDIAVGQSHTIGIKPDGTAVAVGRNWYGESSVSGWTDIVSAEAGPYHSVGVKSDGTVVLAGHWEFNPIAAWTGIEAVAVGRAQTLGLKSDGTVIAHGASSATHGEANVSGWSDIVQIAAGAEHSVGLKSDGTVVAVGANDQGQLNVAGWTDIVAIAAGYSHTVGLKSDGTMVATGYNYYGQADMTKAVYLNHASQMGSIGGTGAEVGLRAVAPAGFGRWAQLSAVTRPASSRTGVKFAVRTSTDGAAWSEPLGGDGAPIDWTDESGNYLGQGFSDAAWRGELSGIPSNRYIDIVVRLEGRLGETPELQSATVAYEANVAPVAADDAAECDEDTQAVLSIAENDSDANGDALTVQLVDPPANGGLLLTAAGVATYTPDPDFNGTDTFTYRASDGVELSAVATVTITVNPMNDEAPVAVADPAVCAEDASITVDVLANDTDADSDHASLVAALSTGPAHGAVVPATGGGFTYTPAAEWSGEDEFTYVVSDGDFDSNVATVTITVSPVPDAPQALGDAVATAEGAPVTVNVITNDTDRDGDTLRVVSVTGAAHGTVVPVLTGLVCYGEVVYTPDAGFSGTDTFTYIAGDGSLVSGIATVTVSVSSLNDPPTFIKGPDVTVAEDAGSYSAPWATAVSAGPPSEAAQRLSFTVANSNPGLFSMQPAVTPGGDLRFTPAANANGNAMCTVTLTDDATAGGPALARTETFVITVSAVNDPPGFTKGANVTVDSDSGAYTAPWATGITAGPVNEAGQRCTFTMTTANGALFSAAPVITLDGKLTFTPAAGASGSAECTVTLTDDATAGGPARSKEATFTITVRRTVQEATLTLTSLPTTLTAYGASYLLSGRLTSGGDVAGKLVSVMTSPGATGLAASGITALTAADGSFSVLVVPRTTTHYAVSFAGDAECESAQSECVRVVPRTWVSSVRVPSVVSLRTSFRVTGTLKPGHAAGTRPVRIYRWRRVTGGWRSYGYVTAIASGTGTGTVSGYSASLALPTSGTWRVRAYAPADAGHAPAWSVGYSQLAVRSQADRAVAIARTLLGRPFSRGGAGPTRFDSSGFTRYVYSRVGVSLPRTVAAQYASGAKVRRSALRPGDLVFYGSPRSVVAIYLGGGKIIGPSLTSGAVSVRRMPSKGFTGAVRPAR